ncbi:hypothetical protein GMYAFLOJ_CDS0060 [Microbacterium phage phiMiGM15]
MTLCVSHRVITPLGEGYVVSISPLAGYVTVGFHTRSTGRYYRREFPPSSVTPKPHGPRESVEAFIARKHDPDWRPWRYSR